MKTIDLLDVTMDFFVLWQQIVWSQMKQIARCVLYMDGIKTLCGYFYWKKGPGIEDSMKSWTEDLECDD